jgi:predicted RNase H-like HicB family nuclease
VKQADVNNALNYKIELEREDDGRWMADIVDLPGVMAYGQTREEAIAHVEAIAFRVLADRFEDTKESAQSISFAFA